MSGGAEWNGATSASAELDYSLVLNLTKTIQYSLNVIGKFPHGKFPHGKFPHGKFPHGKFPHGKISSR